MHHSSTPAIRARSSRCRCSRCSSSRPCCACATLPLALGLLLVLGINCTLGSLQITTELNGPVPQPLLRRLLLPVRQLLLLVLLKLLEVGHGNQADGSEIIHSLLAQRLPGFSCSLSSALVPG